ncbi:MAG: toprim domain-containing protein, partial [Methanomicrobiales archaeon]
MTEQETAEQKKKEAIFVVNTWAQKWFSEQLFKSENTPALDYLKSRWNDESIFNFNIGFAPEGWNNLQNAAKKAGYQKELLIDAGLVSTSEKEGKISTFDYFRNRIIFPIQNRSGRICGFSSRVWSGNEDKIKYLNTRETVAYKKSSILYGFHTAYRSIKEQQNAYLVEGYADVIRLQQLGIYNCVATCGTALSQQQISELKKITTTITIIGDSDPNQSGQKAVKHSAENIIQAAVHCKIISLPQGAEKHDPDSFFQSMEQFIDYEKESKQDYIFSLADIAKTDQSEPEKMVLHIEKISSLVTCLPVATQEHYFEKLQKIIPIKTKWSKKSSQAINNKNVGGSVSKSLGSEKTKHDHDFYSIEKDREGQYKGIKIDRVRVIQKLKEDGFIRYDIGIDSCRFIKIINNTLTEVSSTTIIDHFVSFIENITEFQKEWEGGSKLITSDIIKKKIFDGIDSYFSLTLLKRLTPEKPVTIKKDTQHEKFLFYQNGYVSVSNGGYSFHGYPELDGYI